MNNVKLATALREHAEKIQELYTSPDNFTAELINDTAEFVRVLARVVEGKPLDRAFGAPGDWGYGTPIGDALAGESVG